MPDVFINYRTGDAEHTAAAIDNHLSHRFGPERVFYAGKSIKPAQVYDAAIMDAVHASSVLIAVIGSAWLAANAEGCVPLHEPDDWVRREIREALEHGLHVLPILVGKNAERINRNHLPTDIAGLADRQWERYDHRTAARCLETIAEVVAALVPSLAGRSAEPSTPPSTGGTASDGPASNAVSESSVHGSLFQVRDGGLRHNTSEDSHNTTRQTANTGQHGGIGSMDAGTIGAFFNHSSGPVNTGSGHQYNVPLPVQNADEKDPESA